MHSRRTMIGWLVCFLIQTGAHAQAGDPEPRPHAYALVIGSNQGGPGQEDLRYAHDDADRIREVLIHIGGFETGKVQLLLDPGMGETLDALDGVAHKILQHRQKDEPVQFLFYYSGHARAHALNMGAEELDLASLRKQLESIPATFTLAILDACQTGAISNIKGAEPTADFSYNSVNDLNTAGIAVMASSSASELSQESESLGSSFFTHHLVVGLRGAADSDGDGRITLSEGYRYAYHRTLIATAATAVGKQHVTLETELKGKGETVLTWPAQATSRLVFPAGIAGDVLVHREEGKSVMAELVKTEGESVWLAFPPGRYRAFVRSAKGIFKCEVVLDQGSRIDLSLETCVAAEPEEMGVKGKIEPWREHWGLELGFGGLFSVSDAYNQRLDDFGFEKQLFVFDEMFTFSVAGMYAFNRYLSLVLGFSTLAGGSYERETFDLDGERRMQNFGWSAYAIGVYVRGTLPLFDGVLNPYLQAGAGLAIGTSEYRDPIGASTVVDDQVHWGYHLGVSAGLHVMIWDHFGVFGQANYNFAPVVGNELDEVHDSGGAGIVLGIRGAL